VVDILLTGVVVFFLFQAIRFLFAGQPAIPEPLTEPPSLNPAVVNRTTVKPAAEYASLKNSNLFGARSLANVAAQKATEEKLPETTLDLELLGCVAADSPDLSFAVIRDKRSRVEDTYGTGDFIVADAKLEEVRENEVVISRAGRREILPMSFVEEGPQMAAPFSRVDRTAAFRPPARSSSPPQEEALRVVNENLRYINRSKLMEEVGSNIGQVLNQFRTSPNTVDNKPSGIRIDALGSGPVVEQSGIQSGDVIKSVNGIRVNTFDDVLGLGSRLQNAPEIRVVVERDGRHRTLVYKIR